MEVGSPDEKWLVEPDIDTPEERRSGPAVRLAPAWRAQQHEVDLREHCANRQSEQAITREALRV